MRTGAILLGLMVVFGCLVVVPARAAEQVVWQIGQFDNNYAEFGIAGNYSAYKGFSRGKGTFRPGTDNAAEWSYIQPGPDDRAWAGRLVHPINIQFALAQQPSGVFTLTIDFVSTQGASGPQYEIRINKNKTVAQLPTGPGDEALSDPAKGKEQVLSLPIPASLLKKGQNQITLTIVAGSWALFDALKLTNDPDAVLPPVTVQEISLSPTLRVVRSDGKLKRVVTLATRFSRGVTSATAEIKTAAGTQKLELTPSLLGDAKAEVMIDDAAGPVHAEATVACEGATKTASIDLPPQKRWKLFVQPCSHVDIGYTDYQERCAQTHTDNMSLALQLCRQHPSFKWNTEVGWVEDNFLASAPKEAKAEFLGLAKEGRLGCQAVYGNMLTGLCSHEEFIRNLYYTHNTAKHYGLPYDMASSADVPTQVWTMPSVLAGSGIKYLSMGLNFVRGDAANRVLDRPFYWQGPDGAKVLAFFCPGYGYAGILGLTRSVDAASPQVDSYISKFDRDDYPCDAVFAYGGVSDNQRYGDSLASVVEEWNKRYAYPQIILCRGPEFFQYVEKNWKGKIPVVSGDIGVCWEDGAGSSAMETAMVRQAKETLVSAEKLDAIARMLGKKGIPKGRFDQAWKNAILYDEHTWGAHCSISQPENDQTVQQWKRKRQFALDAHGQTDGLMKSALGPVMPGSSEGQSVTVYNSLGWARSGVVEAQTAQGKAIKFRAENVPPMGYKVYDLKSVSPIEDGFKVHTGPLIGRVPPRKPQLTISNRFYTIRVDQNTGAVVSLVDNQIGRELVDSGAKYGVNQYIYVTGTGGNTKDVTRDTDTPAVSVGAGTRAGAEVLVISGSGYNTPSWTSEIILYDNEKRIDFINKLDKKETYEKEAGYFAFPFKLDKPRFHVELPCGVLDPQQNMQPGACQQWYCTQDFVAVENEDCAITWTSVDAPLVTLSDIYREGPHGARTIDNSHLYSYAFNNYWFTNYKASQGGEMMFRFSMTSSRTYDPAQSSRFGQSVRNPLTASGARAVEWGTGSFSLCSVAQKNVQIQAVKQSESGKGLIVRLRELSGKETTATLSLAKGRFRSAQLCNLVEDPQSKLKLAGDKVTVPLMANGMATVIISPR